MIKELKNKSRQKRDSLYRLHHVSREMKLIEYM